MKDAATGRRTSEQRERERGEGERERQTVSVSLSVCIRSGRGYFMVSGRT